MAASSRIHALMKFGGISTSNGRFLVPSNTRFSYIHSTLLKSLSASSRRRHPITHSFKDVTNLDDAYDCFDQLIVKPPSFNSLLRSLLFAVANLKYYSAVLDMFNEMCAVDIPVYECTIGTVIECYCRSYNAEKVFMVLGFCFKRDDIELTDMSYNRILKEFFLGESTHYAEKLFKKFLKHKLLFEPHTNYTYDTMIRGLCKIGNHFKAIALLRLMDGRGRKYNLVAYNTIIARSEITLKT